MKQKLSLFLSIALLTIMCTSTAQAQYAITSYIWESLSDSLGGSCQRPYLYVTTNTYSSSLGIKTYYGNGISDSTGISNGGSYGYAYLYSDYTFPGTYTTKLVLYNGAVAVDSVINKQEYLYCNTDIIKCVYDSLGTGIYDSALDRYINMPVTLAIAYNGTPIDTTTVISGFYYSMVESVGDIYSFQIIDIPPGVTLTFPASGIIYDTVKSITNNYIPQYFGFKCNTTTITDLSVYAIVPVIGIYDEWGDIYVTNKSCDPVDATVTMNFSATYAWGYSYPAPTLVSGNTVTWNLNGLNYFGALADLYFVLLDTAGDLAAGDTVHENIQVTPAPGASEIVIDSVNAGCDPNEMSVSPSGGITSGTQLQYTIGFENTGNDTAYNISIYDTLSNNVDIKSLNIVMASAAMNIAVLNDGVNNIVRFDFPNINLLDSISSPSQSSGAVIFTVNSLSGLPNGTTIFNHAGIFFDYNPVVMTDTVENIIGTPASVPKVNSVSQVSIYPNPAKTQLTIQATNEQINEIVISNLLGQIVYTGAPNAQMARVDVSGLAAGVYFVKVNGAEVSKFAKL